MTIRQVAVAVSLTGILTGCGNGHQLPPPCPTCPSQAYTLSGVITGTTPAGPAPLAGALVTESRTGHQATTNPDGFFSMNLSPLPPNNTVSASKVGYTTSASTVTISGDTRVDILLAPRPTYTLSGVISEITPTGLVPIEGVYVGQLSYDEATGDYVDGFVNTDANGFYSLSGLWGLPNVLNGIWLAKSGYRIPLQPNCDGCYRTFTLTGDKRLDIQLERITTTTASESSSHRAIALPSREARRR